MRIYKVDTGLKYSRGRRVVTGLVGTKDKKLDIRWLTQEMVEKSIEIIIKSLIYILWNKS